MMKFSSFLALRISLKPDPMIATYGYVETSKKFPLLFVEHLTGHLFDFLIVAVIYLMNIFRRALARIGVGLQPSLNGLPAKAPMSTNLLSGNLAFLTIPSPKIG